MWIFNSWYFVTINTHFTAMMLLFSLLLLQFLSFFFIADWIQKFQHLKIHNKRLYFNYSLKVWLLTSHIFSFLNFIGIFFLLFFSLSLRIKVKLVINHCIIFLWFFSCFSLELHGGGVSLSLYFVSNIISLSFELWTQ